MISYETLDDGRPPSTLSSLVLASFVGFMASGSWVYSRTAYAYDQNQDSYLLLMALFLVVALGSPVLLWWRHSRPFTVAIVASLIAVVAGPWLALASLASLISRRRGSAVAVTGFGVGLAVAVAIMWDALAKPVGASFQKSMLTPQGTPPSSTLELAPSTPIVVMTVCLGVAVGVGLLRRSKVEARQAKVQAQDALVEATIARDEATTQRAATDVLSDEVARRQERERIAREVHDAMGHRLSLLNLHAGAVEANAGDDPQLRDSASLVRQSAGEAMDDLRSLLNVLREPLGSEPPDIPLTDLQKVIQESFGAGQMIISSVFIEDASRAHPTLSRAVYRIVQEVLTNARKYAPSEPLTLTVAGGPSRGISIDAKNKYVRPTSEPPAGSGRGLRGIAERVELLGGSLKYGLDDGGATFRVTVELPWMMATGPAAPMGPQDRWRG